VFEEMLLNACITSEKTIVSIFSSVRTLFSIEQCLENLIIPGGERDLENKRYTRISGIVY
jgi:hypothetical protein